MPELRSKALQSLCVVSEPGLQHQPKDRQLRPQANWFGAALPGDMPTEESRFPSHTFLAFPVDPSNLQSYRAGRGWTSGVTN